MCNGKDMMPQHSELKEGAQFNLLLSAERMGSKAPLLLVMEVGWSGSCSHDRCLGKGACLVTLLMKGQSLEVIDPADQKNLI